VSSRLARLSLALVLVVLCAALAAPLASASNAFVIGGSSSSGQVIPINLATNTVGTPLTLGETPNDLAISPDGKTAYIAIGDSFNAGKIIVLDTETATKKSEITGSDLTEPMNAVVSPDGKTLWVIKKKSVIPVNLETLVHGAALTLPAESEKGGAAISPDGSALWVSVRRGLVRIDTALATVSPLIEVTNSSGNDTEVSPDGKTVYTATYTGASVSRLDVASATALPLRQRRDLRHLRPRRRQRAAGPRRRRRHRPGRPRRQQHRHDRLLGEPERQKHLGDRPRHRHADELDRAADQPDADRDRRPGHGRRPELESRGADDLDHPAVAGR
jgi:DNA-binding beta-propeller fold protein YncE